MSRSYESHLLAKIFEQIWCMQCFRTEFTQCFNGMQLLCFKVPAAETSSPYVPTHCFFQGRLFIGFIGSTVVNSCLTDSPAGTNRKQSSSSLYINMAFTTFGGAIAAVPTLANQCSLVLTDQAQGSGLKALRLVSKQIRAAMLEAVTGYTLRLDGNAHSLMKEMGMLQTAKLAYLRVVVMDGTDGGFYGLSCACTQFRHAYNPSSSSLSPAHICVAPQSPAVTVAVFTRPTCNQANLDQEA